jgi:hypothetical protein
VKSDPTDDVLVADLRALGQSVPTIESDPAGTALTAAVMARLSDVPPPRPASRWESLLRSLRAAAERRRRILVLAAVLLLGGLGVPGVRAAVVEWFTFGGVNVRIQPNPDPSVTQAPPPPSAPSGSLSNARSQVDFQPIVLPALGPPDGVEASDDRRLLSLTWNRTAGTGGRNQGTIRLDEFDGILDPLFAKTTPDTEWTTVAGQGALWFESPHEVAILDADGKRRIETARLAGHTLIWVSGRTTLRLEGDFTLERAVEIAESAKLLP